MGYLRARWHGTSPHQNDRTSRQWTPRHLFYLLYCLAFYCEMRRRMFTMGMLQISTMNYAWLRLAARRFPNTYKNSMILTSFPIHFTPRESIIKRSRYQLKREVQCWKLAHDSMAGLESNLPLASITTQHKRPQCQIFKNEKNKLCLPVHENFTDQFSHNTGKSLIWRENKSKSNLLGIENF